MAGMDNIVSMVGDWTPPLMSNLLNEGFSTKPFSDLLEDGNNDSVLNSEKEKLDVGSKEHEGDAGFQFSSDLSLEPCLFDAHKPNTRSALSERMATRAGFSPLKINTSIRSGNLDAATSEVQSPYLTIPPGLSPTTLLDSPVFLSNLAQPSPTTGKLLFEQSSIISIPISVVPENVESHSPEDGPDSFAFKPHVESSPSYYPNPDMKPLQSMDVSVHSEHPVRSGSLEAAAIPFQKQQDLNFHSGFSDSSDRKDDSIFNQKVSESFLGSEQSPPLDDQQDGEADTKGEFSSVVAGTPAEDGYNWRKYGQKQVKGSEYPRSYYKCTHLNCPVKKKVERSHEGHITEIIYKGAHNHPKPPPNRRSGVASHSLNEMQPDVSENPVSQVTLDGKALLISSQGVNGGHDWKNNGASASIPGDLAEPSASMRTQDGPCFESPDVAIDVSSTLSNDEEDDRATHGSVSLGGEGEGDELESKRRKIDASMVDMTAASRAAREPRVVVQTTSEVDILDDGYRWRKYGQKVVKGNPNPRSYYKCTNPGCTVRKHVERASHDLKSVITTYEGKHNHDVPAARSNNGHSSSGGTSTAAAAAPAIVPQPQNLNRRSELTQPQDCLMRFNASVQLPPFNLPREHLGPPPPANFTFPMAQHGLSSLGIPGLSTMPPMKMPALPPHHYFSHHRQLNEPGFMIPKGEPKEEPMPEPGAAASVYHQMMSRLPLGP